MQNAIPIFLVVVMIVLGILSFFAYRKVYGKGGSGEPDDIDQANI